MVVVEDLCIQNVCRHPISNSHKQGIDLFKSEFWALITKLRYGMHESP